MYGCLSVALPHLVFTIVFSVNHLLALADIPRRWFDEFPQYFLQYLWLAMLLTSLVLGVLGLATRERPKRLSASGMLLTLTILAVLTVFFGWLED